ncbi:MAG: PAS domain S-box protein [Planctomycetota bacterium]|nr:MAG: PAS domain S-box protein [Planctomycetota bacterium]
MRGYGASNEGPSGGAQQVPSSKVSSKAVSHAVAGRGGAGDSVEKTLDELQTIFNATKDSIMLVDSEFKIVQANAATLEFLGKSLDEVIGQKCYELIHESDLPDELCPLEKAKQTKNHEQVELYIPKKDMWVMTSVDPVLDENGNVIRAVHIIRDITARRRMEEALQESEEKFREISEQSVMGIVIIQDYMFKYANEAASDIFEYSVEEMLAWGPKECYSKVVHPDDILFVMEQARRRHAGEKGVVFNYAWKAVTKRGKTKWVETYSKVISFGGKEADMVMLIDISDSRAAEEALRESEEKYKSLFEFAGDALFTMDFTEEHGTRFLDCNDRTLKLFGCTQRNQIIGKNPEDFSPAVQPDGKPSREKAFELASAVMEGHPQIFEWMHYRLDGTPFWVEVNLTRIKLKGRSYMQAVVRDITKREKAEAALRESEELYRNVYETAPLAFVLWDRDCRITDWNTRAEELFGWSREEVLGRSFFDFLIPEGARGQVEGVVEALLRGEMPSRSVNENITKNGESVLCEWNNTICYDNEGHVSGVISLALDITERERAEKRLLEHEAQLKSLASELSLAEERERRRLAVAVHDRISQSLGISKIRLDELRKSTSSKKVVEVLNEVCNSLGQTIGDTRSLTFELGSPVLYELGFEKAVAGWLARQIEKKQRIATEFEDDGQDKPLDDDVRVLLFRNVRELLINVVKHAQAHKVKVSILRVNRQIHVTVEDDGVGFDPEKAVEMAGETGGFGLFSIRERMEQLGGRLEISSKPGHGSKIKVIAPLKREKADEGERGGQ